MSEQYDLWISEHYGSHEKAYGACAEATLAMQRAFPELTRVRGHYYCLAWGERQHWWLTDADGQIVDPTAAQFPSAGHGIYEPWIEGADEPTGKCPNCGGLIYGGGSVCSDDCARSYEAYLMDGLR
jgi:hypothetical protein